MPHQDHGSMADRNAVNHKTLGAVMAWLLTPSVFSTVQFQKDCTWSPLRLAMAAIFWAWSDEKTLRDRFSTARKIIIKMFPRQSEPAGTYQAFTKMLRKWTMSLRRAITLHFHMLMRERLPQHYRTAGYVVFGCDGSRVEVPRTVSNEQRFSPKGKRRKRGKQKNRRKGQLARSRRTRAKRGSQQDRRQEGQ